MPEEKSHIAKLPKSPLQEVIFELQWNLDYLPNGQKYDPGFSIAQGIFSTLIEKAFPFHKRTIPEGLNIEIIGSPIHQFWKGDGLWPVIQLGPGILTVNDTEKNYNWNESFFPLIQEAIRNLQQAYKEELIFSRVSLRYIDAIDMADSNMLNFVNSNFNVNLSTNFDCPGELKDIAFSHAYKLADESLLNLLISSGTANTGSPAILWQSSMHLENTFNLSEVLTWTDQKHTVLSDLFKKSIKREFYERFL